MAEGWTVPPLWRGERCFIIAGGNSVPRNFLRENRLPDRVLVVKDAALLVPDADCMFYADTNFHRDRPLVFNAYNGPLTVKRAVHDKIPPHVKQVRRNKADKTTINGLSLNPETLGGHDSGGSAINLAFHFGVRQIVLVGFDLRGQHWNPVHPMPRAKLRTHELHRKSIDAMAAPLRRAGVEVLNTSTNSSLVEFKRASLTEML